MTQPNRKSVMARRVRIAARYIAVAFSLLCLAFISNAAQADSKAQMQSLDEQVQEIKSDVLGIAAELRRLEEKLLFPSNTQVAVFVSMPTDQSFRLDSIDLQIDGEPVAHHIYSFKELEALQNGGVQRLFIGNVAAGTHELDVEVAGKLPGGGVVTRVEHFRFDKEVEPKLVELSLGQRDPGGVLIELGNR
ncbi:MAG: hypothetical protein GY733_09490 [bacterium]|nr:hypothetical protein [bacterium]